MIKCGSGISKLGRHISLAEEYQRMTSTYYNGELLWCCLGNSFLHL